jgi:hypothetical protein
MDCILNPPFMDFFANSFNHGLPCKFEDIQIYDNEYTSIIDIYFYEYFHWFKSWALVLQNILDTLSDGGQVGPGPGGQKAVVSHVNLLLYSVIF